MSNSEICPSALHLLDRSLNIYARWAFATACAYTNQIYLTNIIIIIDLHLNQ